MNSDLDHVISQFPGRIAAREAQEAAGRSFVPPTGVAGDLWRIFSDPICAPDAASLFMRGENSTPPSVDSQQSDNRA